VNGLLDLSRIEARLNGRDHQPVNLPGLLGETVELYASRAEQAGVFFGLELPREEILVPGDASQLRQALANLLDNAVKFTPPGGSVAAGAGVAEGWGILWVEDTGIGIPPEELPRLFNRFHRGRNAASYPGSGLGLAIVKAVAERHGGHVEVESSPGKTRFTLRLPGKVTERSGGF
jgi:signal transduction histidine kinase